MILAGILDHVRVAAEARVHAVLLARAASELPGVAASLDPAGLRLTARDLRARAFGRRHVRRDPKLALFTRPIDGATL